MPSKQSKRIFLGGLDRDMDPRLLKNGDYHHALNIRNIASEANTQGVIENIKGNKLSNYDFPGVDPGTKKGIRRITLFMPWFNYWNNYSPEGPDTSFQTNLIQDFYEESLVNQMVWPGNFDSITTSTFDGQPDQGSEAAFSNLPALPVTYMDAQAYQGQIGYPDLMTFNIALGFSLAEMATPSLLYEISYNGETFSTMKDYLAFFVEQYADVFAGLGVTLSVIDNTSEYFNEEYFFGENVLNNIASHPNYTPGQKYACALLFEGDESEIGEFYIDLRALPQNSSHAWADYPTSAGLFDSNLHGFVDINNMYSNAQSSLLDDNGGYDPLQDLTDSENWGVATQIQNEPLFLTEYMNSFQSMGWSIGINGHPLWSNLANTAHGIMHANALIIPAPDVPEEEGPPINYTTIGSYEDTKNDKIYWMVAAEPIGNKDGQFHLILEFDLRTGIITTIFRDCGNSNCVFNWRKEFLINDINKIGDVLYWTSRQYGEPCSINVRKSKNSIDVIDNIGPYTLDEEGGDDDLSLEDYYPYNLYSDTYPTELKRQYVEVLKRGPMHAPTYVYADDSNNSKNNLFGYMFQFRYRYHFYDNEVSPWSPISDVVASSHDASNSPQAVPAPFTDNQIVVSVKNSSGIVKYIELAGRRCKDLGNFPKGTRGEFFTIAKIDNNFGAWQTSGNSEQEIDFYNDQLYPFIDAGEGDRLFDAVPRSAQTQTILGNNRLAYGNYTVGYDVPMINVGLIPQYGYSQSDPTQEYGGSNYDSATYGDITGPDPNPDGFGVSSFKSGAYHSFGIVYYDERGRCSTVLTSNDRTSGSQVYVKFPTERNEGTDIPSGTPEYDLYGAVTIKWEINHRAPAWAKHYRWFYSRNTTVDEFIQFRILDVFTNNAPNANDNRLFLSLRGLKGNKDSFISSDPLNEDNVPNPNVEAWDYDFVKGDRIRFITDGDNTVTANIDQDIITGANNYIDVRIVGFEYYTQANPNVPILNAAGLNALDGDGSQDGYYIIIEEVLDNTGTAINGYNTNNFNNIIQSTVEIYRPKQEPGPEETIFFELSKLYDVDVSRRHLGGISDQGMVFTQDAFGNFTSDTPATGEFLTGDVYYKERNMRILNNDIDATTTIDEGRNTFYVESYFLNDYLNTNHASLGRANLYSPFYKKFDKISSITYSDVYQPATNFNGLSTFDNNTANYRDYSEIDGSIQRIYARDTDVVVIYEDKTYNIPVQKDIILSASGEENVGISNQILGPPRPYNGHYGISKNPESFVVDGNVCYWVDMRRGAVIRLKENGISPISEVKMIDYFRDKSETYKEYDPQYKWEQNYGFIDNDMLEGLHKFFRVKGGFNPKHTEYIVQFDHIHNVPDRWEELNASVLTGDAYDDSAFNWELHEELEAQIEENPYIIEGSTIAWAEPQNRWVTNYSHISDYYGKINILFTSWKNGALYLHDMDEDNYNTFYGITYYTELDFYINEGPSTVKGFKTITLEANQAFESDENGVEEEVLTSYDVDLKTDMTETSINRHNFDQRENKQYAQIPFVTTGSTGSEVIGLGEVTYTLSDSILGPGLITAVPLSGTDITQFAGANIIFQNEDQDSLGFSNFDALDPTSQAFSDTLYYHNNFPYSNYFGQDIALGTITGIGFINEEFMINQPDSTIPFIQLNQLYTDDYPGFYDNTGSPLEFLDQDGNPSDVDTGFGTNPDFNPNHGNLIPGSTFNEFVFIKRPNFAEGDRMKGRYMEVKMKKRSKKLLEIFSGSATIFNSELSDD